MYAVFNNSMGYIRRAFSALAISRFRRSYGFVRELSVFVLGGGQKALDICPGQLSGPRGPAG